MRNHTSDLDPRRPEEYSAGYVRKGEKFLPTHIGGDRMSMKYHGYSIPYSYYLQKFSEVCSKKRPVIVEVGVLRGVGLAIWCDLFPEARVIGLDLDPGIFLANKENLIEMGAFKKNDPEIHYFDQFEDNRLSLEDVLQGDVVDVVIDDGAHTEEAILKTASSIQPYLSDEFLYFVEDFGNLGVIFEERFAGFSSSFNDGMTVVFPRNGNYPSQFPSKKQLVEDCGRCS